MSNAMADALLADAAKLRDLTGESQWFMVTCDNCDGAGGFETHGPATPDDPYLMDWVGCPDCHGSGWASNHEPAPELEQDELPPPKCGGSGEDDGR